MSLLNTKPRWAPQSIATERGWTDPVTGEVYVSIKQLATRLAASAVVQTAEEAIQEGLKQEPQVEIKTEETQAPSDPVEIKEEVKMEASQEEVKQEPKRRGRPAKVITEVVEYPADTKIIGEVVEAPEGKQIIAE